MRNDVKVWLCIGLILITAVVMSTLLAMRINQKLNNVYHLQRRLDKRSQQGSNNMSLELKRKTDTVLELMILDRFVDSKQNRRKFVTYISTRTYSRIVEYGGLVRQYCFYETDIKALQSSDTVLYQRFGYWLDWLCNQPEGTTK